MDSFLEGLNIFKIGKLIALDPKRFERLFINTSSLSANDVKKIISTEEPPGTDIVKLHILNSLGMFLDECTQSGMK